MGTIPTELDQIALHRFDNRLRDATDEIRRALLGAADRASSRPGDIPSGKETRELLGLFARLQSEELRQALVGLLRTIVEAGTPRR